MVNTPPIDTKRRFFAMRKSVKGFNYEYLFIIFIITHRSIAFTDSMLDLIVKDSVKNLVDFYGKEELIYFGNILICNVFIIYNIDRT